jgi:addiction module HigA family antidote
MARIRTSLGEVLYEEFMKPLGLSANALALALRVPATRIGDILRSDKPRAVSADTAIRLARYFGTTPEFWLNLSRCMTSRALSPSTDRRSNATCARARTQPPNSNYPRPLAPSGALIGWR